MTVLILIINIEIMTPDTVNTFLEYLLIIIILITDNFMINAIKYYNVL